MPVFDDTAARLRACRLCRDTPLYGPPLPQE
ncbi:MAG: uracil-DNA glycosylase family protein, partial [Hyphomicrobiales bacterium]